MTGPLLHFLNLQELHIYLLIGRTQPVYLTRLSHAELNPKDNPQWCKARFISETYIMQSDTSRQENSAESFCRKSHKSILACS